MADIAFEPLRQTVPDVDLDRESFAGMAFPFKGTVLSTFAPKSDEDIVRSAIEMILFTRPGERVMRPDFGSFVPDLLWEPNDDILAISLRATIEEALVEWEDRIQLGEIEILPDDPVEERVRVRISAFLLKDGELRQVNIDLNANREGVINAPFPVLARER